MTRRLSGLAGLCYNDIVIKFAKKTDELLLIRFADIMINHMFMMPVYSLGLVVCVKLGCTTEGIRQAVAVSL